MKHFKLAPSFLTKNNTMITYLSIPIALFVIIIGCNRQLNDSAETTYGAENAQEKTTQTEVTTNLNDLKVVKEYTTKNTAKFQLYDKYYGEKKFEANYISEYGMKFRELTFLIDTNYLEACPGHFSQIAFYATAPTRPQITFKRISGEGKIYTMKSNEKSGTQTLGNFQFRPKIKEIGTHIIEIKAAVGIKGEPGYVEKTHQITIEAACKKSCPPFTEKIIPEYAIPRVLPYDVYITSAENSAAASNKKDCKTAIDIQFKDTTNNNVKYQIFEGITPFIENPTSKQIHKNPAPKFSGTGNGQQNNICNGAYYIELTDPQNGCRTHKAFEAEDGALTSENLPIFKPDTLYKEKDGEKYMIVNNPHPLIEFAKYGPQKHYFKFKYRENLPHKFRITKEKGLEITKQLLNFDETYDSLSLNKEKDNCAMFHKGVEVNDLYFVPYDSYIHGLYYNGLNVNVEDIISKADALEIGKQKAIELGYQVADTNDMNLEVEERKRRSPNFNWGKIRVKVLFYIEEHDNVFVPCYWFKLYTKKFRRDPVFWINANNGDVLLIENDGVNKCASCQGGAVVKSNCVDTHPFIINPDSVAFGCEFNDSKVHQFNSFPDIFDECSSIKSKFYKCENFEEDKLVQLSDVNYKIITFDPDNIGLAYISLINTAYNKLEVQQLTAFKNVEQTYEYYNSKLLDNIKFNSELPFVFIVPGFSTVNNAYAIIERSELEFGDGSKDNCEPNVSTDVVAHEFTHLMLGKYVGMSYDRNSGITGLKREDLLSVALHESLSDIMAILYNFSKTDTLDWVLFNELCSDSLYIRHINDPAKTKPKQKILYDDELIAPRNFDPYKWAGIINYWFYLMTESKYKEANNVVIGEGIGIVNAEQMMFKTFEKLAEIPNVSDSLSAFIDFVEFRDAALAAAEEIFKTPDSDFNVCSPEYSKVYLAFKAVGLIDSSVKPPCNILIFDENIIADCPSRGSRDDQYNCSPSSGKWQLSTGFPNSLSSNPAGEKWLIQKAVDKNENGSFELVEFLKEEFTGDITTHRVTIGGLATEDTEVKIIVTNVTALSDGIIGEIALPSFQYIFSCNNGCNLITDINFTGFNNEPPPTNTGNIVINAATNYEVCAGKTICIDYNVNGPAYMYVDIIGGNFTKTVNQPGANTTGQFCWSPTIADLGRNTFKIAATDGHPVQPLKNNKTIHIDVDTYNAGCLCAGEHPEKILSLHNNIRTGHYTAIKDLDSDATVYGSSDVLFKAGSSVTLNDGFYVPRSTKFNAFIENCVIPDENINSPK